jgi:hypothetical protein
MPINKIITFKVWKQINQSLFQIKIVWNNRNRHKN